MNGMCKCIHSRRDSAFLIAGMILAALLALLPAAGCEKKGTGTPPQPEQADEKVSRVASTEVLPPPQKIFDRHIEVTGGRKAYEKLQNVLTQGTITVTRSGQETGFTEYGARANKFLRIVEPDDRGVQKTGCDGETVWLLSEEEGPFIISEEAPKAALMQERTFNRLLRLADLYEIVETVGIEEIGDIECYHVLLTPPQGLSESNFYSIESGLLVMRRVLVRSNYGDVQKEEVFSEYEETGGIRSSRKSRKRQKGREFITIIDSIEYNVDLADDFFDLPDEVRAALDEANAASSDGPTTPEAAEQP